MTGRHELEAEREFLLGSLRDLEAEHAAGELADDEYEALRDSYTARAGAVLRRLRLLEAAPAGAGSPAAGDGSPLASEGEARHPATEPPSPFRRRLAGRSRRRMRVAVAVAGLALVGAGGALMALGGSGNRQPGQPASGSLPPSPAQELTAARHAMATGDQVTALRLYQAVLNVRPDQPEALAYSGWLLRLAGVTDQRSELISQAMAAEQAAEAADPTYPDPYFFLGVILLDDRHQPAAAAEQFRRYLSMQPSPAVRAQVQRLLQRAESEAPSRP